MSRIELSLGVEEFSNLVARDRFSRFTLIGIESPAGRFTVMGKLRRPLRDSRYLGIYSKRHAVRSFKTLESLVRFCNDSLGIYKAELDIEQIRGRMN